MDKKLSLIWAKTGMNGDGTWHPLIFHMLDVAACADAILAREPDSTRIRIAAILGLEWEIARAWILLVVACHDLGKACPGFQCKWENMTGIDTGRSPNTDINHAYVSQIALTEILLEKGWPDELAELVADAVGCHHGNRASSIRLNYLSGDRRAIGKGDWTQARLGLVDAVLNVFMPVQNPVKQTLSGPDFMLLSGLTSFADWIGSNEEWFPFGGAEECGDLPGWFQKRRHNADLALDAIGWEPRTPLSSEPKSFQQVFDFVPRPLQQAVADVLVGLSEPAIILVEAPMGEGKTEAAFFAHLELQRRFGHRGLYVALPTKATGNAMFKRTIKFIRSQGTHRKLDLQLLHGGTLLNDTFQNLRLSGIHDPETGGDIRAGEWFTNKKRALLSEYGVGTVDQALLPILPVRHNFVRLWGLANRVVVFDEIHAYDAYTGTLLIHLLRWLLALGSSVVLLSATLPPSIRRKLADAVSADLPAQETQYPRLSVFCPGKEVNQIHFEADPGRRLTLRLVGLPSDLPSIHNALVVHLAGGGMGLALLNTVQRAQDLYRLFSEGEAMEYEGHRVGKRLSDGTEVFLFHARFPVDRRQKREDQVLKAFGQSGCRDERKILIATQVAEQSLDLDFDLIATDLAPIDLVLQRAGRLWRHARSFRPVEEPVLLVAGLAGDEPPSFEKPLWWGSVYREDLLLSTWCLLHTKQNITLPDEIDSLVQAVYEEQVDIPEFLAERMNCAIFAEGKAISERQQANMAIIGFPDDASWKEVKFEKADEDEPGLHRSLVAQTRLGEPSVMAIPIFSADEFDPAKELTFDLSKDFFLRAVNLSRKGVVKKLQKRGVPEGWKKSSLLRNCFPLVLDAEGRWTEDAMVRLDDDLGLVYQSKEAE
ncbi:CRISPR-associated helicase/endonuclease Cas3 [Pelobacter propionicus]|uniref:CRISPR-associated helicase, Cas3 family n=1 Tax=Pelobacter propionicus (strain DSM 2379 / NBRC 103807 / OttBd1) TaxID=338966 RepID=A1ARI0_PELPD|nr:CRISPR-associated helicase/endonuclease Cas3 [Pelobacter propionicus]ABK99950.1 CRISPR-associated helicase, Cas3 family [Pelobacter propionicus DSM 2379]